MRCPRCKGKGLSRSGREPYRFICDACGQHYFAVMQLIPVDSGKRIHDAGTSERSGGGPELPE